MAYFLNMKHTLYIVFFTGNYKAIQATVRWLLVKVISETPHSKNRDHIKFAQVKLETKPGDLPQPAAILSGLL